ncbi:MAG: oligosaccharide flippase family protein [Gammaproteobacteria bacterium]|jgi:O-antigen/teichoic acid export membrane protein|nr:oligosaccharide flippase family protein [Gammaproteobacteria bacterium]
MSDSQSADRRFMRRGSLSALAINGMGRFLGLAVTLVFARVLGSEGFGAYSIAISWVTLLAMLAALGFPTLLLRELSNGIEGDRRARIRGLLSFSGRTVLVVSTLLALAGALLAWLVYSSPERQQLMVVLCLAMLMVPLRAFSKIRNGALRGMRAVSKAQLPELVIRPAVLLLLLGAYLLWLPGRPGAMEAILLQILAGVASLAIGTWWLWKALPTGLWRERSESHAAEWLRSATHMLLFAGMTVLLAQSGIIVMGLLSTEAETGVFALGVRISEALLIFMAAVNMPLMPIISRLLSQGQTDQVQEYLRRGIVYSLSAIAPFAILVFVFSEFVLTRFGEGFAGGELTLRLLVVSQLLNTLFGPVGLLLNVGGLERQASHGMAAAAVLSIVLSVILIPEYGAAGAAWAMILSTLVWNTWLSVVAWRRLRIVPGLLWLGRAKP